MDLKARKKENEGKNISAKDETKKKRWEKDYAIEMHSRNMKASYLDSPIYNDETMERIYDALAQNLHIEMDKEGLTLRDIEERCGVSASHLSRIFNGSAHIGLDALIRVAAVFDMSPVDFYPLDNNKRLTIGQLIDDAIRPLDINTKNDILEQIRAFVRIYRRIKENKHGE